jgi:hypothetical protein
LQCELAHRLPILWANEYEVFAGTRGGVVFCFFFVFFLKTFRIVQFSDAKLAHWRGVSDPFPTMPALSAIGDVGSKAGQFVFNSGALSFV